MQVIRRTVIVGQGRGNATLGQRGVAFVNIGFRNQKYLRGARLSGFQSCGKTRDACADDEDVGFNDRHLCDDLFYKL